MIILLKHCAGTVEIKTENNSNDLETFVHPKITFRSDIEEFKKYIEDEFDIFKQNVSGAYGLSLDFNDRVRNIDIIAAVRQMEPVFEVISIKPNIQILEPPRGTIY